MDGWILDEREYPENFAGRIQNANGVYPHTTFHTDMASNCILFLEGAEARLPRSITKLCALFPLTCTQSPPPQTKSLAILDQNQLGYSC